MKLEGGRMELKDIKELMKVLKKEEMHEIKVRYGKVKLTLTNSEREQLSRDIKNMLERIDQEEDHLKYYFPENPKLKTKEDNNKTKMPFPPPNLNFG